MMMSRPCHYTLTQFHDAIRKGSMADVEHGIYVLGRQAIQLTQACGRTAVEYACMYGHIDILDRILLYVYRDRPKLKYQTANELFDLACNFNQDKVAQHLVQRHGAVPLVTEADVYLLAKKGHFKCLNIAFEYKDLLSDDLVDLVLRTVVGEGCSFRFYELGAKFLNHPAVVQWMQMLHPFFRMLFRNEDDLKEALQVLEGLQFPADAIVGGFEDQSFGLIEAAVKLNAVHALDFVMKSLIAKTAKADIVERCADQACSGGLLDLLPYLVEQGLNTNYSDRWHTRLVNALIGGKAPMVIQILKRFKHDISDLDTGLRLSSLIRLIFEENDGVSLEELLSWEQQIWLSIENDLKYSRHAPEPERQNSSEDTMNKMKIENPYSRISAEVTRVGKNYLQHLSMDVLQTLLKFGLNIWDGEEKADQQAENSDGDISSRYQKIVWSDVPKSMDSLKPAYSSALLCSHVWKGDSKAKLEGREFCHLKLTSSTVCLLDYLPRDKPCIFPFHQHEPAIIEPGVLFRSLEYLDGCSIYWEWSHQNYADCLRGDPIIALFAKWVALHEIQILGPPGVACATMRTPSSPESLPASPQLYDKKTSLKFFARKAIRTAVWSADLQMGNSEKFALLNYFLPSLLVDYVFPRDNIEDIHKIEAACNIDTTFRPRVRVYLPV